MNTHDDTQLTRELGREADRFVEHGGRELEMAQVLARAGEIKRGRRMRATMLMAACVLAIAAPTALVVTHRDSSTAPQPTHKTTQTPQTKGDLSPLSLGDLHVGDSPHHGFSEDGTWQLRVAANGLGSLQGQVAAAAAVDGGALVAMQTDAGDTTAVFIHDQGGTSEHSWPMETGSHFAVSAEGNIVTFVAPDGTPMAYQDGTAYPLPKIPAEGGYDTVAAFGPDCSVKLDFESCGAWVTTLGRKTGTWEAWSSGVVDQVAPRLKFVTAVSEERIAGVTKVRDDLSTCSEVERFATGKPQWTLCGYQLTEFSPDGTHVLARPDGDGAGDGSLAIYSADGKQVFDLPVAHDGFIYQAVWEDDSHVLATVYEQGRWAVLRIGLDGSREYAVEPVQGADETRSPFVLPTL